MSRPPVLVPVNVLDRAKGRLAELLTADQRRELAIITLRTVVAAASGAGCDVIILTADPAVATLGLDAVIEPEADGIRGLNPQLEHWLAANVDLPELLVLHADLPLATPGAIVRFLHAAPPAPSVTAIQSPDGGTNAMLLRPVAGMSLHYGPGSFALHHAAAESASRAFHEHTDPALSLDLDTPADVRTLLSSPIGSASPAGLYLCELVR